MQVPSNTLTPGSHIPQEQEAGMNSRHPAPQRQEHQTDPFLMGELSAQVNTISPSRAIPNETAIRNRIAPIIQPEQQAPVAAPAFTMRPARERI